MGRREKRSVTRIKVLDCFVELAGCIRGTRRYKTVIGLVTGFVARFGDCTFRQSSCGTQWYQIIYYCRGDCAAGPEDQTCKGWLMQVY